jgi:uncharacterized protein
MSDEPDLDGEQTRQPALGDQAELPACVACGACCFFDDPRYILVFEEDETRLGGQADLLTHWVGSRRFMRIEDGHCAALRVEAHGAYVCSVYENRPRLCREFERGSLQCTRERTLKTPRALAALRKLKNEPAE